MTAQAQYFQLIDFNQVDVISLMIYPPRPTLVVAGVAPYPGAAVSLVPLQYVSQPPFWGIQVVCEPGGDAEPSEGSSQYTVELDLAGVIGTHGVEVIGATRTQQLTLTTATESTVEGA